MTDESVQQDPSLKVDEFIALLSKRCNPPSKELRKPIRLARNAQIPSIISTPAVESANKKRRKKCLTPVRKWRPTLTEKNPEFSVGKVSTCVQCSDEQSVQQSVIKIRHIVKEGCEHRNNRLLVDMVLKTWRNE